MTDFWFPTPPGLTALPPTPPITTDPNPAPPNTVAAPGGFDPLNPDLDNLFNVVLPVDVPPVYEETMEQTIALTIPAYNLAMTWESILHLRAQAVLFDFGPSTESASVAIKIKGSGDVLLSQPLPTSFVLRIPASAAFLTNTVLAAAFITRVRLSAVISASPIVPSPVALIKTRITATINLSPTNEFVMAFSTNVKITATQGTDGYTSNFNTRAVITASIS